GFFLALPFLAATTAPLAVPVTDPVSVVERLIRERFMRPVRGPADAFAGFAAASSAPASAGAASSGEGSPSSLRMGSTLWPRSLFLAARSLTGPAPRGGSGRRPERSPHRS